MAQIRKARPEDLAEIEKIYALARQFMASTGNPTQWGVTHPPRQMLEEDIVLGQLYVLEDSGIRAVFAYLEGEDPTYGYIEDGAWLSQEPYGTIHRVASDGSGGRFSQILAYALSRSSHLRIDTYHDNRVMQHVLKKHGFHRCGIIYLEDGDPRIAYELI
jgi:hypothetical protein